MRFKIPLVEFSIKWGYDARGKDPFWRRNMNLAGTFWVNA
jgi:hypothetical protein